MVAAVDFDKQSYWHARFAKESSFEWLTSSDIFMSLLEPHITHIKPSSPVLNIGSGTSDLHNHLRARGITNVTNLDYEPLAAQRGAQLEEQAFGEARMAYVVADATKLRDPSVREHHGRYHLVVDKGTSDAIACGGDEAILAMARGIRQCLAQGGVWVALSYSTHRFDVHDLPFNVTVIAKVPTSKLRPTDPDIYHWCYLLSPN